LTAGPQAGERYGWVSAASYHDLHLAGPVAKKVSDPIMNRLALDSVIVIQNQGKVIGKGGDLVDEGCQQRGDRGWPGGLKQSQRA
jgi:hypothetical protein